MSALQIQALNESQDVGLQRPPSRCSPLSYPLQSISPLRVFVHFCQTLRGDNTERMRDLL